MCPEPLSLGRVAENKLGSLAAVGQADLQGHPAEVSLRHICIQMPACSMCFSDLQARIWRIALSSPRPRLARCHQQLILGADRARCTYFIDKRASPTHAHSQAAVARDTSVLNVACSKGQALFARSGHNNARRRACRIKLQRVCCAFFICIKFADTIAKS